MFEYYTNFGKSTPLLSHPASMDLKNCDMTRHSWVDLKIFDIGGKWNPYYHLESDDAVVENKAIG